MKPLELIEQGRFLGEEFVLWRWMECLSPRTQSVSGRRGLNVLFARQTGLGEAAP